MVPCAIVNGGYLQQLTDLCIVPRFGRKTNYNCSLKKKRILVRVYVCC
jgi:hypothetical protein